MKWNPLTRRHFLQGAGRATLLLPILPSLFMRELRAYAQAAAGQKNFIGVGSFNGAFRMHGPKSELMPATNPSGGTIAGFTALNLSGKHRVHSKSLAQLSAENGGKISRVLDSSFTPYLNKMILMQGFDNMPWPSDHHRMHFGNFGGSRSTGNVEIGWPTMASIDQVMAHSPGFYKNTSLLKKSVAWSCAPVSIGNGISFTYRNPDDKKNSAIDEKNVFYNPATLWDAFFAGGGGGPTADPLKGTLVDKVLADYNSVKVRLGPEEKQKLDAHLALLHDTQTKVRSVASVCRDLRPSSSLTDRHLILTTMNSVIASIINCGLCHSFVGFAENLVSGDLTTWHDWGHTGYDSVSDTVSNQTAYDNLITQNSSILKDMCLDLAIKLDQVGQLDNSLIVKSYEHSKRVHDAIGLALIVFGGAGGTFKTGQYLDYRNLSYGDQAIADNHVMRPGYPMNQALANFLRAVDVPKSEFEPLNYSEYAYSRFKAGSGYSHTKIYPHTYYATFFGDHYGAGWQGHDLSDWLPFITG